MLKVGWKALALHKTCLSGSIGMNVIAENKRASPSKGQIRDEVDPKRLRGRCTSVEAPRHIRSDRREFLSRKPGGPSRSPKRGGRALLRKDFLITPYQIYESAVIGADAVLLIVRALSAQLLRELISLCDLMGLDALVEVHNEAELETAMATGARIIGINNRDLETFRTDIQTSINLARLIGPGHVVVSESGIHGRAEIERLLDAGIFNFLIGESLMRSEDPEGLLQVLYGVGS